MWFKTRLVRTRDFTKYIGGWGLAVGGYEEMLTSSDKMGGSKKDQKHADVILEWSLRKIRKQSNRFGFLKSNRLSLQI